jgi:hypothetical protein
MVGISKRFEKRTLKSHGLAGCGKSVFSISVNAGGAESKGGRRFCIPPFAVRLRRMGHPGKWAGATAITKTTADRFGMTTRKATTGKELSAEVRGGMLLLGF